MRQKADFLFFFFFFGLKLRLGNMVFRSVRETRRKLIRIRTKWCHFAEMRGGMTARS